MMCTSILIAAELQMQQMCTPNVRPQVAIEIQIQILQLDS